MVAMGERQTQQMEYEKTSTLLGMSQQRLAAANQARADATNQLVGGLSDTLGGLAGGGAFSKKSGDKGGLANMFKGN
jgi:predicted lipid-binding transport protein (Tim44 family)